MKSPHPWNRPQSPGHRQDPNLCRWLIPNRYLVLGRFVTETLILRETLHDAVDTRATMERWRKLATCWRRNGDKRSDGWRACRVTFAGWSPPLEIPTPTTNTTLRARRSPSRDPRSRRLCNRSRSSWRRSRQHSTGSQPAPTAFANTAPNPFPQPVCKQDLQPAPASPVLSSGPRECPAQDDVNAQLRTR